MTCPGCVARARGNLHLAVVLADRLRHEAVLGRRALHVSHGIPGGDALVLLAPGHYTHGHALCVEEEHDPRPPLAVLAYWSALWRDLTASPTDLAPTLTRVHDHLHDQLHRIAKTELFPTLATDLARTVRQLEDVLHDGDRPETSKVPCLACGTRLAKVYAHEAKDDHWACPRCRDKYDPGRYERAKHDWLASTGAEKYVPIADAVGATGRPEQTVRAWIRRGDVSTRRNPRTRRLEAWWPDVRTLHLATPTRKKAR